MAKFARLVWNSVGLFVADMYTCRGGANSTPQPSWIILFSSVPNTRLCVLCFFNYYVNSKHNCAFYLSKPSVFTGNWKQIKM